MNILLVTPAPKEPFSVAWPTLGLCYLSSYLKSKGVSSIEGIDLNVNGQEDLERAIDRNDLVGIYCSTKAVTGALKAAEMAKARGKLVVMGGPHASVLPEEILSRDYVDFVILSEGEESFHELVKALESGASYEGIDGFGYKRDGRAVINPKSRYIKNLDDIPFPDRGLFNYDSSVLVSFCATRGCPYKCANCQPALSIQTCRFRMRSVDNIIEELKNLGKGKFIHFVDNDLSVNKKWLAALCERIIAGKLNIRWDCQGRVNTLTLDLMKLMKRAGCASIGLGVESGSQEFLDKFLHKNIRLDRARELFREALECRMPLHCWFIIGTPTETKKDIERTIEFALESEVASVGFSVGTPWPGTTFHQVAKDRGWLLARDWDEYNEKRNSRLRTDEWGPEDIENYRSLIFERFRAKGWEVNENDFIMTNPYLTFSPLARSLRAVSSALLGERRYQKLTTALGAGRITKIIDMANAVSRKLRK